jgi:subtilisin family serine protease
MATQEASPVYPTVESRATGHDDTQSVIVQMEATDTATAAIADLATDALIQRSLALSARDCLPPDLAPEETVTEATPRPLLMGDAFALRGSLLAQADDAPAPPSDEEFDRIAEARLEPLLENARVQDALAARSVEPAQAVEELRYSGAIALDLSEDDIRSLVDEVPGIATIHENRQLRVPAVGEVLNVPEDVRETRIASWGLKKINALATWGAYGARGKGARVAVLDTGVDASHPDLKGKIEKWAEFDSQGHIVQGSQPHDGNRHGTHVAGTIVGGNASGQWIGVAPEATLCCGKVLGPTGGTDVQILAGITWAIAQEVDVISLSLGGMVLGPDMPPTYTEAILKALNKGIPVVIAIGNEGSQTSGSPGNDLFAFAVGATDSRDRPGGFSGGGTKVVRKSNFIKPSALPLPYSKPDVSAPGVAVVSCVPGGKWAALNGTSMATPHVAGALALMISATKIKTGVEPAKRAFTLSDLLTGSVEELGESGQDHRYGFGRIDVLRAIDLAKERGY